jgi:cytochrome c553
MKRLFIGVSVATAVGLSAGSVQAADAAAGAEKAKSVCAACHGADGGGVPSLPDYPKLAGQKADYLVQALRQYKSGARKNPIMGGMAQTLSAQDMENIAAYFAAQPGPLFVTR